LCDETRCFRPSLSRHVNRSQRSRAPAHQRFHDFIRGDDFPCVGAKAASNRGGLRVVVARDFRSAWDDLRILPALLDLARRYRRDPQLFVSLAVLFEQGAPDSEEAFEGKLWERLQSLSDKDAWLGQQPDPRVAHDPADPHFGFGVRPPRPVRAIARGRPHWRAADTAPCSASIGLRSRLAEASPSLWTRASG